MSNLARTFPVLAVIGLGLSLLMGFSAKGALTLVDPPGAGDFVLFDGRQAAGLVVATNESAAVIRAAGDLAADVNRVTGATPGLVHDAAAAGKTVVVIGTLGRNPLVDGLVAAGKLDVAGITGQWESTVWQVVPAPWPGVDAALVIAGSDRRGTIFGIYGLSELIGVSPWYWWADVPVTRHSYLAIHGGVCKQGPPAVKYRGIFLNDEDWGLRPWAARTFDPGTKNIGPKTYAKFFELLLRLRSNYLWPAMHPGTAAFNSFPEDAGLADEYGIVMGSSHCEQMLRNNISEWNTNEFGEYNYVRNRPGVLRYWDQRVQANGRYENTYTVGMRGIHDGGMPGGGTTRAKAERLHHIIDDQRAMLAHWVNPDVAAVPQVFCPYKEVLELYRLAPDLPADITLVWPDDNYGYVRQFSNAAERQRRGGAGVYYHISYWGAPADYLWLNTTPPALIEEEMTKAYDYGASNIWILNVGDMKPGEIGLSYFLQLAWDPHGQPTGNADQFLMEFAGRVFGPEHAGEIAAIWREYYRLSIPRKPEHLGLDPRQPLLAEPVFSTTLNGDEAGSRRAEWEALASQVEAVAAMVPAATRDAYFELVGYPVKAAAAMNEQCLDLTMYYAWAQEGRATAYQWVERARAAHQEIVTLTDFYNHQLAGGKWRNMMDYQPRNLRQFQFPSIAPMEIPYAPPALRLVLEGSDQPIATNSALPAFNAATERHYFVDVFNGGSGSLPWHARASAHWIQLSQTAGTNDGRVVVRVDWASAPGGPDGHGEVDFTAGGQVIRVAVHALTPAEGATVQPADFVEDNHQVIMEAEHASTRLPGKDAQWRTINGLGYNGQAVGVVPVTVPVRADVASIRAEAPRLQYRFWLEHGGDWRFTVRSLPTFSVETGKPQRYAIAVDDETPQVVGLPAALSESDKTWQENVLRNCALTTSVHSGIQPGLHTLKLWMVDPGIVIDTIAGEDGRGTALGYLWPAETRRL